MWRQNKSDIKNDCSKFSKLLSLKCKFGSVPIYKELYFRHNCTMKPVLKIQK